MYPHYKNRTLLNGHWIDGVRAKTQQAVNAELGHGRHGALSIPLSPLAPLDGMDWIVGWSPSLQTADHCPFRRAAKVLTWRYIDHSENRNSLSLVTMMVLLVTKWPCVHISGQIVISVLCVTFCCRNVKGQLPWGTLWGFLTFWLHGTIKLGWKRWTLAFFSLNPKLDYLLNTDKH